MNDEDRFNEILDPNSDFYLNETEYDIFMLEQMKEQNNGTQGHTY